MYPMPVTGSFPNQPKTQLRSGAGSVTMQRTRRFGMSAGLTMFFASNVLMSTPLVDLAMPYTEDRMTAFAFRFFIFSIRSPLGFP